MFYHCTKLKNIEKLKYLETNEVNNFSGMFSLCLSLSDIKSLENWNVSKGNIAFLIIFLICSIIVHHYQI